MKQYRYVTCRATGHSWEMIPSTRRPPWGTLLTFCCTDCGTIREDVIDSIYNLSTRKYYHPDDYKTGTVPKSDWRRDLVRMNRAMVVGRAKGEPQ